MFPLVPRAFCLFCGSPAIGWPKCAMNVNYGLHGCLIMETNLKDGANRAALCGLSMCYTNQAWI